MTKSLQIRSEIKFLNINIVVLMGPCHEICFTCIYVTILGPYSYPMLYVLRNFTFGLNFEKILVYKKIRNLTFW